MQTVLTEIINILVAGLTALGQGIGSGLQSIVTAVFVTGEGTQASPYALSVFGGIIAVFGGIALAVGLTTLVVRNLGNVKSSNIGKSLNTNTEIITRIAIGLVTS